MIPLVHHEDQFAIFNIGVLLDEQRAVVVETPIVTHSPNVLVEGIEVVPEPQVERVSARVPIVRLDVVVLGVPGHGRVVAATTPVVPHGRPEVHVEKTPLVHVADCFI